MNHSRPWVKPALVLSIDLLWSLVLEQLGRPLFVGMYPGQQSSINQLVDRELMPLLWISYGIVLSAQIGWLTWASRQLRRWRANVSITGQVKRLRRAWWCCALGQLALAIGLQLLWASHLEQVEGWGLVFVLAVLLCDLVVIFWLPTALLVPEELGHAVPLQGNRHRQTSP